MLGKVEDLAAETQQYPIFEIQSSLATVRIEEDGTYSFSPKFKITPNIGGKAQFTPERFEIWDGSTIADAVADRVKFSK